jgi:hypothetical protein
MARLENLHSPPPLTIAGQTLNHAAANDTEAGIRTDGGILAHHYGLAYMNDTSVSKSVT